MLAHCGRASQGRVCRRESRGRRSGLLHLRRLDRGRCWPHRHVRGGHRYFGPWSRHRHRGSRLDRIRGARRASGRACHLAGRGSPGYLLPHGHGRGRFDRSLLPRGGDHRSGADLPLLARTGCRRRPRGTRRRSDGNLLLRRSRRLTGQRRSSANRRLAMRVDRTGIRGLGGQRLVLPVRDLVVLEAVCIIFHMPPHRNHWLSVRAAGGRLVPRVETVPSVFPATYRGVRTLP